jgi:putative hemolysin
MDETMELMLANNYSRYPVYEEDIDNVTGILYFKDFVKAYLEDKNTTIENIMVKPSFIHPTLNISTLFKTMQREKIHMVVVVDEYGQTEGIVAMEDILEEIVGNIFDEYDEARQDIVRSEDGYVADGMTELDELAEVLEIEFPDEDFHTVNGFILYELGRFPYKDEKVDIIYQGYEFSCLGIEDKMITKVKITKAVC